MSSDLTDAVPEVVSTRQHFHRRAWDMCSLLVSIGGDAKVDELSELASRRTPFQVSPDFIELLCRIPNSPITMTRDFYVTLSFRSLSDLHSYVSDSGYAVQHLVPQIVEFLRWSFRRRKRVLSESIEGDKEQGVIRLPKRARTDCHEVHYNLADRFCRATSPQHSNELIVVNRLMIGLPTIVQLSGIQLGGNLKETEEKGQNGISLNTFVQNENLRRVMAPELNHSSGFSCSRSENEIDIRNTVNINGIYCLEGWKQKSEIPSKDGGVNGICEKVMDITANERTTDEGEGRPFDQSGHGKTLELFPLSSAVGGSMVPERESKSIIETNIVDDMPSLSNNPLNLEDKALAVYSSNLDNQSPKSPVKAVTVCRDAISRELDIFNPPERTKVVSTPQGKQNNKNRHISITRAQKLRPKRNVKQLEEPRHCTSSYSKDPAKPKVLPDFESYTVMEEEGSGGYGTVYRAKRKSDGTLVAIKCPHADAHKHHVNNEQRMLERFGGKSFVIKYEGCFKSGNSDCFVLEHVEHDRPEVLKKEIDIFHLQWYGYCMFRALASLHKQGIAHRDVKPGNFLFSRKTNKGYLIDFNLAMDLNQKYRAPLKSRVPSDLRSNHAALPNAKSELPKSQKNRPMTKSLNSIQATKDSRLALAPHSLKKNMSKIRGSRDLNRLNQCNSQGADGSGITSAKDGTSTRTPSGERLREPLPCHGRKELISFLQETMSGPNHQASRAPASMRKRVAAEPEKVETCSFLTPMPLKSNGLAVAGGEGKSKKEGSCAGTKGFRAPEVCFRSPHQGTKIDVWSAGVTLLYLIVGKSPFTGDQEQNVKEIAKLRGSEDLWELAKLHNRESSFPEELYDIQYLPSMELREWCVMNTRRRNFLEVIPKSLFDLVDKCLTVNPRLRISAEDALKHDFFAPVTESLRKQRMLRQGNTVAGKSKLSHEESSLS